MKREPWAYRLFQIVFATLFVGLCLLVLLAHNNPIFIPKRKVLLALSVVWGAILLAVGCWWHRRRPAVPRWLPYAALALYFAVCIVLGTALQVGPHGGWDYPVVAACAQDMVLNGSSPSGYFAYYPNNSGLLWCYVCFFKLVHAFGGQQLMPALTVLGCAAIAVGQYLVYRSAVLLWGESDAFLVLLFSLTHPALLLYGGLAYTDTLTLPLAAGAVYLWLKARAAQTMGKSNAAAVVGAFALAAAGGVLKISVAVLAVAFVLDVVLQWQGKQRWKLLAAGVGCFAVLLAGGTKASRAALPRYESENIPYTHWVMMGLHGNGGYWDPDYQLTLQYDTYEERVAFNVKEIGRRIAEMGPAGFAAHCLNKLSYILSDGTNYAPVKLNQNPVTPNRLHEWVVPGAQYVGRLCYAADAWQLCMLALCAWGTVKAVHRRDCSLTVVRVAVFGLLLFLLLWEARSRYIVNFLPLFLLCAGAGLCSGGAEE